MKKKIIVPVDFSAASHNAYLYARGFAADYKAAIEVIHVYDEPPGENEEQVNKELENLKKQLSDFIGLYPKEKSTSNVLTKVEVSIRLLRGLPVKSILRVAEHPSISVIVMGMTGAHKATERIWGTVSSSVAQKADCPVLLIPSGAKYASFKSILYASNYESATQLKLNQVISFADIFDATIHFIHVRDKEETADFTETEELIFEQLFKNGDPDFTFNMAAITAKSVIKGLNQYAEENDIDLITLVNNQRGFVESMFGQSMTKEMAFHTKLPLMVFHLP